MRVRSLTFYKSHLASLTELEVFHDDVCPGSVELSELAEGCCVVILPICFDGGGQGVENTVGLVADGTQQERTPLRCWEGSRPTPGREVQVKFLFPSPPRDGWPPRLRQKWRGERGSAVATHHCTAHKANIAAKLRTKIPQRTILPKLIRKSRIVAKYSVLEPVGLRRDKTGEFLR